MDAGLYLNPQTQGPEDDKVVIDGIIAQTKLAEEKGFNAVWATEHCFTGYNAYSDPVILGTHLMAVAPSLHLGFAVVVGPLHHPIRFANQISLLDNLCDGRLIVGLGSGAGRDEFNGYGVDLDQKKELGDAWERIVVRAWQQQAGDPPYHYDTPWWKGTLDGRIIPAPYTKPMPLIARATLTPATVTKLAHAGRPLLLSLTAGWGPGLWDTYLEGLAEADLTDAERDRALKWTSFTQQTYISSAADPVAEMWGYAKNYLHKNVRANNGYDWASDQLWEQKKQHYRSGTMNAGSAQQVLDKLAPWAERGMRHTMVWTQFGDMPTSVGLEQTQRFAEEVLPHLQRITAPPTPWGTQSVRDVGLENDKKYILQ